MSFAKLRLYGQRGLVSVALLLMFAGCATVPPTQANFSPLASSATPAPLASASPTISSLPTISGTPTPSSTATKSNVDSRYATVKPVATPNGHTGVPPAAVKNLADIKVPYLSDNEVGPGIVGRRVNVNCAKVKCVALTFDDGPGPYTAHLLDILKQKDVPATFFVVGWQAKERPNLIKREYAEGHAIGNHTWHHWMLSRLPNSVIVDEIKRTAQAVKDAIGIAPRMVRPPYGDHSARVDAVLRNLGQALVFWDVDSRDWQYLNREKDIHSVLSHTRPGVIILMHDIHQASVAAVPTIIDELKAKGYHFVTVPQLVGGVNNKRGHLIFSQHEG